MIPKASHRLARREGEGRREINCGRCDGMRPAERSPESTEQLRRKDVAIREREILIASGKLGKYPVNHSLFEVVGVGDGESFDLHRS